MPVPLSSFIGREVERAEVARLLGMVRLLTLTGASGCNKTRLALEPAYPDGTWLVALAAITDTGAMLPAVASAIGVREELGQPVDAALTEHLRGGHLLLVLDNCEHLSAASAAHAAELLAACPGLTVLATSRVLLGVLGETVWRVPSLPAPDPERLPELATLTQHAAARLFIERAAAV